MTVQDYLNLITSEYNKQPNFTAMISQIAALPVQIQSLLTQIEGPLFDLSTPPVGQQLDVIGQWVGISRNVNIPITGIYFSWNDTSSDGWDYGSWEPYNAPTTINVLPDSAYLTLIQAKIVANSWDGTIDGAYKIWDTVFPSFRILFLDNQNMTYGLAIVGGIVDALTLALLTQGYLPLRPEGVMITEYLVATDSNPAFGWDVESTYIAGWNEGSWLREIPA